MVSILSFASFKRAPERRDWSGQELAEFYRVQDALSRLGLTIETERGLSDENEPWFAFCSADGCDVLVHFARIDGQYVVASALLPHVLRGIVFRDVIDQFLAAQPVMVAPPPLNRGPRRVLMHPSALLTALILTVYVLFEGQREARAEATGDGSDRHGAQPGLVAKLLAQVQTWFSDEGQKAAVERMAPQMAFLAVAVALIQDREISEKVGLSSLLQSLDEQAPDTAERGEDERRTTHDVVQAEPDGPRTVADERLAQAVESTEASPAEAPNQTVAETAARDTESNDALPAQPAVATAAVDTRSLIETHQEVELAIVLRDAPAQLERGPSSDPQVDTVVVHGPRSSAMAEFTAIVLVLHGNGRVEFREAAAAEAATMLALIDRFVEGDLWRADALLSTSSVALGEDGFDLGQADSGTVEVTAPLSSVPSPAAPVTPAVAVSVPQQNPPSPTPTTLEAPVVTAPPPPTTLPSAMLQDLVARFVKLAGNAEFVVDRGSIIIFDPDVFRGSNIGSMTIKQYEFADGSDITLVGLPADIAMLG